MAEISFTSSRADGMTPRGLEPSLFVRRCARQIAEASHGVPIVDLACGSGRNAIPFARLGCTVICLDRDLESLYRTRDALSNRRVAGRSLASHLVPLQSDLANDPWPFSPRTLGGIVNVHYLDNRLFPKFAKSMQSGAYLLLETISGHGGNYLDLPKRGDLRSALEQAFALEVYEERKVGPPDYNSVAVRLLARRKG